MNSPTSPPHSSGTNPKAASSIKPGGRICAILLGTVAALVVAELSLRLAGFVAYTGSGRGGFTASESGLRILCHGDSNVFGVFEPPEESYPGQLAVMLDELTSDGPHTVVNLGVPGFGLRQLLSILEADITRIDPEVILVTIGANDAWHWMPEAGAEYVDPPFWESFRLVKTVRLFFYRRDRGRIDRSEPSNINNEHLSAEGTETEGDVFRTLNREGEEIRRFRGTVTQSTVDDSVYWENLRLNLIELHELAKDRLVLACYGSNRQVYGKANGVLRRIAAERGIPLIDASYELEQLEKQTSFSEVFWSDLHPRGLGYEVIARACFDKLVELELVDGRPFDNRLENLKSHRRDVPSIELKGSVLEPETLQLKIAEGDPGRIFRVVFWDNHFGDEPPADRTFFDIQKDDLLYRKSFRSDLLLSQFDEQGERTIPLGAFFTQGAELESLRFRAGYIVYSEDENSTLSRFSNPVILEFR